VQPQANANVWLGNVTNQFSRIYSDQFLGTATHANLAYFLGSGTALNPSSVNVAGNIVGYATTISSNVATGAIVSRGGLGVAGDAYIGGLVDILSNTQATSTSSGALQVAGGASLTSGNLYIGGSGGTAIVATGNILPSSNVASTNNIGSNSFWWNNFYGVSTQARYADLAENYQADADYAPGTVLEFGGVAEVTIAEDGTRRVAGVVSTNPAHLMNGKLSGLNVVPVALQGRVPCKVRGKIQKGDMLISGGNGFARPDLNPQIGTVIGKALEDFDGIDGVIEVVVGRV
jgi:hypothetical protein